MSERIKLGVTCTYCGSNETWIEQRLTAMPIGSFSLSGMTPKVSARYWPWAVCDGCGHESKGKYPPID